MKAKLFCKEKDVKFLMIYLNNIAYDISNTLKTSKKSSPAIFQNENVSFGEENKVADPDTIPVVEESDGMSDEDRALYEAMRDNAMYCVGQLKQNIRLTQEEKDYVFAMCSSMTSVAVQAQGENEEKQQDAYTMVIEKVGKALELCSVSTN